MNFARSLSLLCAALLGGCTSGLEPGGSDSTRGDGAQALDSTFACGNLQCDAKTEYCFETFICVAEQGVDLGSNPNTSCMPIPTQCLGKSEKDGCSCTLQSLGGHDGDDNPLGITPDSDAPAGTCTLALNCA